MKLQLNIKEKMIRRGGRAMFYQGMTALTAINCQGYNIWDY